MRQWLEGGSLQRLLLHYPTDPSLVKLNTLRLAAVWPSVPLPALPAQTNSSEPEALTHDQAQAPHVEGLGSVGCKFRGGMLLLSVGSNCEKRQVAEVEERSTYHWPTYFAKRLPWKGLLATGAGTVFKRSNHCWMLSASGCLEDCASATSGSGLQIAGHPGCERHRRQAAEARPCYGHHSSWGALELSNANAAGRRESRNALFCPEQPLPGAFCSVSFCGFGALSGCPAAIGHHMELLG